MHKLFLMAALLLLATPVKAAEWQIDLEKSKLGFTAQQQGAEFSGTIPKFNGHIEFDEKNLKAAKAEIAIYLEGVQAGLKERDEALPGENFLNIEKFPRAFYRAEKFEKTDVGFVAHGALTLKGVTLPVDVNFTLEPLEQGSVKMLGQAELSRLAFKVGEGEWQDTNSISDKVKVNIELYADAMPPVQKP